MYWRRTWRADSSDEDYAVDTDNSSSQKQPLASKKRSKATRNKIQAQKDDGDYSFWAAKDRVLYSTTELVISVNTWLRSTQSQDSRYHMLQLLQTLRRALPFRIDRYLMALLRERLNTLHYFDINVTLRKQLSEANQRATNETPLPLCQVCRSNVRDRVFEPCQQVYYCFSCCRKAKKIQGDAVSCPVCRRFPTKINKVHY